MERMRAVVRQQNHAMGDDPFVHLFDGRALLMFDDPAQRSGVS